MAMRVGLSRDGREFLDEVQALIEQTRRDIEAHSIGLDPKPAAKRERRRRVLGGDFTFFAYTYFPHHIRGKPSEFQAHYCERVPQILDYDGGRREWWRAPRGEAKTSLATKITPCYATVRALMGKPEVRKEIEWTGEVPPIIDYMVILGAELRLPTKLLEVIKLELTVNPALAMDFPEVCGRSNVWKVGEIVTRNGVRIEPFGADQAIRGTFHGSERPKLALADDLITDKEAKSPTIREKRWSWLEQAIEYLGPPDGSMKFIGVGTSIAKGDPITRAGNEPGHIVHTFRALIKPPKRMDLWAKCEERMLNADREAERELADKGEIPRLEDLPSYRYYRQNQKKMDAGAVTSWPAVRTLYELMRKRARNKKAFEAEMQQNPRSDEEKVFTGIQFWVQLLPAWVPFGGCDPSMGQGQTSHPSAICIGYMDLKHQVLHVAHASSRRRVPSKLSWDLITLQREHQMQAIGFENNNAYEAMRQNFIEDALREQVILPLVPVTATVSPEIRIEGLEPFINSSNPKILCSQECRTLLEQLEDWPEKQPHHHYDILIALHLLWQVAVARAGGLPTIVTGRIRDQVNMRGYDAYG
jgi:hypothetical protein